MLKMIIFSGAFVAILLLTIIISAFVSKSRKLNKVAELIRELLPGLNCGQCGRKTCAKFAVDISKGKTIQRMTNFTPPHCAKRTSIYLCALRFKVF